MSPIVTNPFQTPVLTGEQIHTLIPQRAPIVMVDSFYGVDEHLSYTGLTINESNIFCSDAVFSECGVIEHIAQSAAARVGYIYTNKGEPVPLGFIGSVDKMTFHQLPHAGDTLHTTLKVEQEVFDITMVSATVYAGEKLIAEGLLKIFLKKEA